MTTITSEKTIWGIHGGRTSDADALFLKKNFIVLGRTLGSALKNQTCKLAVDRFWNRRNLMHTAASVFRPILAAACKRYLIFKD